MAATAHGPRHAQQSSCRTSRSGCILGRDSTADSVLLMFFRERLKLHRFRCLRGRILSGPPVQELAQHPDEEQHNGPGQHSRKRVSLLHRSCFSHKSHCCHSADSGQSDGLCRPRELGKATKSFVGQEKLLLRKIVICHVPPVTPRPSYIACPWSPF